MRKYGLIGFPLGHSFSQKYFTEKFTKEWIADTVYENFPLNKIYDLPGLLEREHELCGLNVTIPYKTEVIPYLDFIDSTASDIGSVNVIKISRKGDKPFLAGYNSDVYGIEDSLKPYLKNNLKNALVLGTGGSSRSVCYVLGKLGIKITQVSRESRNEIISYNQLTDNYLREANLIINTTPLGMFPEIEGKPDINYSAIGKEHILFDLVYNPEITAFLQSGLDQGATVITGLKMLHSQAERAWKIWNDNSF
jgi:shikimate dehydrogenase